MGGGKKEMVGNGILNLMVRRLGSIGLVGILMGSVGCASTPVIRVDQGPPQTHLIELEQKLNDQARQMEEKFAKQGAVYEDPLILLYLEEMGSRLARFPLSDTPSIHHRFKILRDPTVNAFAMPNGSVYYHMGLLAKMRNNDMVAAVTAHELSHILHRDSLYHMEDYQKKTVAAKIAQMVLVPGAALVGAADLVNLALNTVYAGSVAGYGREKEARADRDALERLQAVGANPFGLVQTIEVLLREEERYQRGIEIWFLMDHPSNRKRLEDAKAWLASQGLDTQLPLDDPEFLRLTDPMRIETARLNIQLKRYFHALDLIEDVLARQPNDAVALALQAECYRLLAEDPKAAELELNAKAWRAIAPKNKEAWRKEWQAKALEGFGKALAIDGTSPDGLKGLGFLQAAQGETEQALQTLNAYLAFHPNAKDRRFVSNRIEQLKKKREAKNR
jgi:Zn-dependent protease with chaperone function